MNILRYLIIGIISIIMFSYKEYVAATICILAMELLMTNKTIEETRDKFKGIK